MKTIYPNKLKDGDIVQVIAPSNSAAIIKKSSQKIAQNVISKELKLKVSFGKNIFETDILNSSSLKSKIDDLNNAFSNKKVKGIFCVTGGYNSNVLLKYINWENIKSNPKPISGFSDITLLANAIYAKTGLVTYVGPNFSTFGYKEGVDYIVEYFKKCLFSDKPFQILPSKMYGERKVAFKKNPGFKVVKNGSAEGTIIGGHLSTLNLLHGTEFMPSLRNTILFIETDDFGGKNALYEFERDLQSLLHQKDSNKIKGFVFGRFQKGSGITVEKLKYIISSKSEIKNVPIIANVDFGHAKPIATIPIGGTAKIEANNKSSKIEILKH